MNYLLPEWCYLAVLLLTSSSVWSQRTNSTSRTDDELVVCRSQGIVSAGDASPLNCVDGLNETLLEEVNSLVFEIDEFEFQRTLVIRRNLSITSRLPDLRKVQLSCGRSNQMFKIERRRRSSNNITVELRNVRITNCSPQDERGVVHIGSGVRVVFHDVEIVNNGAEGSNDSIVVADSDAMLEVTGNSVFSGNHGRVILVGSRSEVLIKNSTFSNNTSETNGTVLATISGGWIQLNVTGSLFESNVARNSSGGVLWLESSTIVLENGVQFVSNSAGYHGGALFVNETLGLRISNTLFRNNSCLFGKGGAVFLVPSDGSDTRIHRSIFKRNSANGIMGMGGALSFGNTDINSTRRLYLGSDVLFLKNTARVSGGAVIVHETRAQIHARSAFINNSAQGAAGGLHMFSSESNFIEEGYMNATVGDASFVFNRAPNRGGGAVFLYGVVSLSMSSSICRNNSGSSGGAVHVHDARRVVFDKGCRFEGNSATMKGGSLYVDRSYVDITNCSFIKNKGEQGGSIAVKDGETFHVQNCSFEENTANSVGGAIEIENVETLRGHDTRTTLQHVRFLHNRCRPRERSHKGFGGAMRFAGAGVNARVDHCLFENNTAYWGGSLYLAEAFSTTFVDTNFSSNTASLGGAIYVVPLERELLSQYDRTTFIRCRLRMNEAEKGGAVYARPDRLNPREISDVSNSLLSIEDSYLIQNRARDVGGGMFLALMNTSFTECSFRNNLASRVYSKSTASLQVPLSSSDGGAVYASDGSYLTLSDTIFLANSASGKGGAVCIDDALFNCTRNCTFRMNRGREGGGIFGSLSAKKYKSNQPSLLRCNECLFRRNNARKGGGIYASISRLNSDAQQLQVCQGSNTSHRNTAGTSSAIDGCEILVFLDPQKMRHNIATETGHAVFSTHPQTSMVATESGIVNLVQYANTTTNEDSSSYMFASPAHTVKSNDSSLRGLNRGNTSQAFGELEFHVLDSFNQTVKGSRIAVELWQCPSNSACCFSETKGEKEEGTALGVVVASRIATNGRVNFEGQEISDNTTGRSELPLWACFIDEEDEQVSLTPMLVNISFRDCYRMERRDLDSGGCQECDPGLRFVNENDSCTNCPDHATCRGLTIIPGRGYWHATSVSHEIYRCRPREACVEDKERQRESTATNAHKEGRILHWTVPEYNPCNTGYEGILCGSCKENHGRWNDVCTECLAVPLMWISLFASLCWNMLVLLLFIYSARSLVKRARYNQLATSQHQRNQVSHSSRRRQFQQIQTIPRIPDNLRHSGSLHVSFSDSTGVSTVRTETQNRFYSSRSILRQQNTQETIPSEPLPLTNPLSEALKIILNFIQVVYLAALLSEDLPSVFRWSTFPLDSLHLTETVFLIIDCLLKKTEERVIIRMTLQSLFPLSLFLFICLTPALLLLFKRRINFGLKEVKLAAVCTVYLYFVPEIRTLLKFLDRVKVEDEYVDLGASDFWSVDTSVKFLLGSHAVAVGVIVFPLLIAFTVCFPFSLFVSLRRNKDRMQEEDVVSCYGFLYKGYEPRYYYWEIVIVIRKTVIAIVSVFVENAELQSVLISLTLVLFLSLQLIVSPYSSDFPGLNILESLSLGVSTLMFLGVSLMLRSYDLNKTHLLYTIAWLTISFLFVTMIGMGMGLFAATHDFLSDQLVETKIYPDKKSLDDVSITAKVSKLARFYWRQWYARLAEKVSSQAPTTNASSV